jgi:hypothetical protein
MLQENPPRTHSNRQHAASRSGDAADSQEEEVEEEIEREGSPVQEASRQPPDLRSGFAQRQLLGALEE